VQLAIDVGDAAVRFEEDVLADVPGVLAVSHQAEREVVHGVLIAGHQLGERLRPLSAERLHEAGVFARSGERNLAGRGIAAASRGQARVVRFYRHGLPTETFRRTGTFTPPREIFCRTPPPPDVLLTYDWSTVRITQALTFL
jgi:hypothetical protein